MLNSEDFLTGCLHVIKNGCGQDMEALAGGVIDLLKINRVIYLNNGQKLDNLGQNCSILMVC